MKMKRRAHPGLQKAIALAGGVSAMAELVKLSPSAVSQWKEVPLKYVGKIVGEWPDDITRAELRPDEFGPPP